MRGTRVAVLGLVVAALLGACGPDDRSLSEALAEAPCELPASNEEFRSALQDRPNPGFLDISDFGNGTDYEEFVVNATGDQLADLCAMVGQPRE